MTGRALTTALRLDDRITTPLARQFRFLLSHQPSVSRAQHDAVKAYDDQVMGISSLQAKIASEHQRLQDELG